VLIDLPARPRLQAAGRTGPWAGWAPALPSPPGCRQAGWHPLG